MTAILIILSALFVFPETYSTIVRLTNSNEGQYIEMNNKKVHYIEKGQGPDLLLIHGLSGAAQNFSYKMIELLAKNYHVVAIDRPGSGFSQRDFQANAELPEQAKFVAQFIKEIHLEKPIVVGHSLGGAVALQLALDYPESVKALGLIAPLTQMQSEEDIPDAFSDMAIRSDYLRQLYARTLATPKGLVFGLKTMNDIFKPEKAPFDFATKGGGLMALDHLSFYNSSSDLAGLEFSLSKLSGRYGELKTPLAILYGHEDAILNPKIHGEKIIQEVPHSTLRYTTGGHMLIATQPELCKEFIDDLYKKVNL